MTIARIWRTNVSPDRADDYERFAKNVSLPMFRVQQGFAGVLMLRDDADCLVITLWNEQADITALSKSESYNATVEHILNEGFLMGEQTTESYDLHLSWLPPTV